MLSRLVSRSRVAVDSPPLLFLKRQNKSFCLWSTSRQDDQQFGTGWTLRWIQLHLGRTRTELAFCERQKISIIDILSAKNSAFSYTIECVSNRSVVSIEFLLQCMCVFKTFCLVGASMTTAERERDRDVQLTYH